MKKTKKINTRKKSKMRSKYNLKVSKTNTNMASEKSITSLGIEKQPHQPLGIFATKEAYKLNKKINKKTCSFNM
jgi:hypothetical protein